MLYGSVNDYKSKCQGLSTHHCVTLSQLALNYNLSSITNGKLTVNTLLDYKIYTLK